MKDIADDLGVSLMTVSKALRNHSDISEKTRNRVLKRMRELNYQPDWIARSMVTGRTFVVGLVLPNLHSFFGQVAKAVAHKLQPLGYQVVISDTEEDGEVERRHVDVLVNRRVDGLIIASAQRKGRLDLFRMLDRNKIPYVLIDRMLTGAGANYVGVKDDELGAMATEHLIAQGCRRVAHIRGPAVATGLGRLRGYRRALARRGLTPNPAYISSGPYGDNTGYDSMRELLRVNPHPDGVFCYNDHTAAGAMKAILEANLRVPEDIAVIGAGNVRYSDLLRVPLSTIDQSCSTIGETAADLLVNCMDSRKPSPARHILIPPRLVVRASSRRKE
jgi:LacI family transcriptional regulator